jgi:hypothetical protein
MLIGFSHNYRKPRVFSLLFQQSTAEFLLGPLEMRQPHASVSKISAAECPSGYPAPILAAAIGIEAPMALLRIP